MISNELLNSQSLKLIKNFKEDNPKIYDIVAYGSVVRGKMLPKDTDLAIILHQKLSFDKKLGLAQELRHCLGKILKSEIDVKCVDMDDLTDPLFIARKAIIAEGLSMTRKKNLAEAFGFKPFYIFTYSLSGLSHSKKVIFGYALGGRRGQEGLLKLNKCEQLGKGAIKVPLEHAEEFKDFFEKQNVKYRVHMALIY